MSFSSNVRSLVETLQGMDLSRIHMDIQRMRQCAARGGTVLWFGNGGSAAQAQHFSAELMVRLSRDRAPIGSIVLSADPVLLTAHTNDYDYTSVFERQIVALGRPNDIAIGLSTSGKSVNVIRAMRKARACGLLTVAITGRYPADELVIASDILIAVPSEDTARIQEVHTIIGHTICEELEALV